MSSFGAPSSSSLPGRLVAALGIAVAVASAHAADQVPDAAIVFAIDVAAFALPARTMTDAVTTPIERAVANVAGLESMRSVSSNGRARVVLQFAPTVDAAATARSIADGLSVVPLPLESTDRPVVHLVAGTAEAALARLEPVVVVTIDWPGAWPAQVERDVTLPVEKAIDATRGITRIRSNSWEGRSTTYVEFAFDADVPATTRSLRDAVARVRPMLPTGAREPVVEVTGAGDAPEQ